MAAFGRNRTVSFDSKGADGLLICLHRFRIDPEIF
jgi:hypothetical protein